MSSLTYGDTTIPYTNVTQFRQEAVYDDQGDTDRYLNKFDITVQGVLNFNYLNLIAPDLLDDNGNPRTQDASEIMQVIRDRLLEPRQTLSMTFNGKELIPQNQSGNNGSVDAANGPKPQSCVLVQLTNQSFLLHYNIVAHYFTNYQTNIVNGDVVLPVVNLPGSPVLFNRWTEIVDIDNANFTTYTREGKFVIRSDNFEGLIADQLRVQMAVVGVLNNCLRQSSRYQVSPDGLGIQYRIVDREVYKKPPPPAYEADGSYTETTTKLGAKRYGQCHVRLKGDRDTDQSLLLDTAIAVVTAKIASRGRQINPANIGGRLSIPQNAMAKIDLYNNVVEFSMQALLDVATGITVQNLAAFKGMDTATPLSDSIVYTPVYKDYGTLGYVLQAAAYYDPALLGNALDITGQLNNGFLPGTAGFIPDEEG